MIKKLRIKFIVVAMLSIFIVLGATIGAINISNYIRFNNEINNSLTYVIEHGFDEPNPMIDAPIEPGKEERREHYFIVAYNSDGTINKENYEHIIFISHERCREIANQAYNEAKEIGQIDHLRYRSVKKDNLTIIGFVDEMNQLTSFNDFLINSLIISAISYVLIFVLIYFSSARIFKVSELSYQKQKTFITNASHELKTPLTVISTDLELIEMDYGKSEWTISIKDQVNRLTTMTNQLVTLSRLDEGNSNNYPSSDINLSKLLFNICDTYKNVFEANKKLFDINIEDDITIHANQLLINELITIFLDNANKYANKEISVSLSSDSHKRANLIFSNDIEQGYELDVEQMFDRFYRSPSSKAPGSGIGLSIAKEIIQLYKGTIKTSLEANKITFNITF